jgi:transcriptional regulator with XRE-family HTH domain
VTTIEQIIGARVARLRVEHGMTQVELGQRLEPFTGLAWSRQNLRNAEVGNRAWSANDVLAVASVFGVSIAELFTPLPEQRGHVVTAGGAVIKAADLAARTTSQAAIPAQDAATLVRESARLAETIHTLFGSRASAWPDTSRKESAKHVVE